MTIDNYASSVAEQMKEAVQNAFWAGFQYAQSLNLNDEEFVDLGLPSGTKWSKVFLGVTNLTEEGDYFSYIESQNYSVPTEKQLNELRDCCQFIKEDEKVVLLGPNGNEIVFNDDKIWDNKSGECIDVDSADEFRSPSGYGRCTFWLRSTNVASANVGYIWPKEDKNEKVAVHVKPAYPQLYKHHIRLVKCEKQFK